MKMKKPKSHHKSKAMIQTHDNSKKEDKTNLCFLTDYKGDDVNKAKTNFPF